MTADGTMIGRVNEVDTDSDIAHVKPESDLDSSIRQKLGWTGEDDEVYELPHSSVQTIDDRGIHLNESF